MVAGPAMANIGLICLADPRPVHGISREIGAEIGAGSKTSGLRARRIADLKHWAGLLISLAVEQEFVRVSLAQDHQVALQIAERDAARRAGVSAFAAGRTELGGTDSS